MLSNWLRVFYSNNGVLTDYSLKAQTGGDVPMAITAAEDYLYVGQYFPFNNLFVEIKTANDVTSAMTVEYWNNESNGNWTSAVDLIDDTSVGGKTLAQTGVVQWEPNRQKAGWINVYDTTQSYAPAVLNSITVYDLYWARLKFSADLKATTAIKYIGYMFTDEASLTTLDPDINDYLTSWTSGKTSWLDQRKMGTERVVLDLKLKGYIKSPAQVLRFDNLKLATAYRTLGVIYDGLGQKFIEKKKEAIGEYNKIMTGLGQTVDTSNSAIPKKSSYNSRTGWLTR